MSIRIHVDKLTKENIKEMDKALFISPESTKKKFNKSSFYISPPKIPFVHKNNEHIYVPFSWGLSYFGKDYQLDKRECFSIYANFIGTLREEQKVLETTALEHLHNNGSTLVAIYPGFGKTITSLSILAHLKVRTLIVVNKLVLVEQWRDAIKNYLGKEVFFIKGKNCKIKQSDIYIVNAINLPKHDIKILKDLKIGCVIIDECHLILTKVFSQALFQICPRYLVGLSATPYRPDGFNALFELYFGKNKIHKSLHCPHKVYSLYSNIKVEHKIAKNGNIDWNSVIEEQSTNKERNELIIENVVQNPDRNILILCKRIKQMITLHELLKNKGIESSIFKESDVIFNKECRILISSFQKVGTGFSHDKLDMLILGVDTEEYFLQYLGRVFRRKDSSPIILDIIDDHPVLLKHFRTRKKIYKESGGVIIRKDHISTSK
jgi:superfamily II DNA or RNA helicase